MIPIVKIQVHSVDQMLILIGEEANQLSLYRSAFITVGEGVPERLFFADVT